MTWLVFDFLLILWRARFRTAPTTWPKEQIARRGWRETILLLLLLPLATAAATLAAGVFADAEAMPLAWVRLVAEREYVGAVMP